jgi:hypothetical protein
MSLNCYPRKEEGGEEEEEAVLLTLSSGWGAFAGLFWMVRTPRLAAVFAPFLGHVLTDQLGCAITIR